MTNFDKLKADIQNMSAEEFLNKFIDVDTFGDTTMLVVQKNVCTRDNCTSCSMCLNEWLNQEVKE